jgi:hypothetical protein
MNNDPNTQLPVEVVDKIEQEAHNATSALYSPNNYDEFTSFRSGWEKGATAYASKLLEVEQENARLKIALENVYRIHGAQWSEYDRNVIKDLIK